MQVYSFNIRAFKIVKITNQPSAINFNNPTVLQQYKNAALFYTKLSTLRKSYLNLIPQAETNFLTSVYAPTPNHLSKEAYILGNGFERFLKLQSRALNAVHVDMPTAEKQIRTLENFVARITRTMYPSLKNLKTSPRNTTLAMLALVLTTIGLQSPKS